MLRCVAVCGGFLLSRANLPVAGCWLPCPVPRGLALATTHACPSPCVLAALRWLKTQQLLGWLGWGGRH